MPVLPPSPGTVPGLVLTANDLIRQAMMEIHVLAAGENPEADEAKDCLAYLNQMMDFLQIDKNMIFTQDILDFAYVIGQQSYTMGTGGDFDTPRPPAIEKASTILGATGSNPIELPIQYTVSETDWQNILIKSVGTTYPWIVYDDGAMPYRNLKFWPIPNDASNSVRLYCWEPLSTFPDLVTPNLFPPGYTEMVKFNLAVRICGMFQGDLQASTIALANETLRQVRTHNIEAPILTCDDVSEHINAGSTGLSSDIPPNY